MCKIRVRVHQAGLRCHPPPVVRAQVLARSAEERYPDFGPTLLAEELAKAGIVVDHDTVQRAHSSRTWRAEVRASVVAMKRVTTVEQRARRKGEVRWTERRKRKPTRVPARAIRWWNQPWIEDQFDTERLIVGLGDEAKSRSPSTGPPPTGKPEAGRPPVRLEGRGSGRVRSPYAFLERRRSRHRWPGLGR